MASSDRPVPFLSTKERESKNHGAARTEKGYFHADRLDLAIPTTARLSLLPWA